MRFARKDAGMGSILPVPYRFRPYSESFFGVV